MPTLSYTHETMPKSSEEFQRQLAEAMAASNPIDDLLELAADLRCFEEKYAMASEEFYRRFKAGQMGDDFDFFGWSSCFRMYTKTRRSIESALMRAAVWPHEEISVTASVPVAESVAV
ncbi:MAG: hypothetical protein DWI57_01120 [Chloroflexi bacterium]|nr:MAG: hypothetical protein DWI57_01120 [Chloroflexota bacterium]